MINIKFKSNIDFSNDSEFIPMTTYQEYRIDGRLVSDFLPALDILDVWNGKNIVVQQTIWKHWYFDINMSSAQMEMLSLILLCEDIVIQDTTNNIEETLDTSSSEYNLFEKSDLLGQTSNFRVIARLRSNPIAVNRQTVTTNVNYINIDGTKYYTRNAVIQAVPDSEFKLNKSNKGLNKASTSDFKDTLLFVFYGNAADKNTLKEDFETTNADDMTCYNGTSYQILENRIVEITQLGDDFYKSVVTCVIDGVRNYL